MPPETSVKIGKFKASRIIVSESWTVFKQDKELVLFPILSVAVRLIGLGLLVWGYIMFAPQSAEVFSRETMGVQEYVFIFVYYVVMFCITNFFQSAMYIIISARFNGSNLGFNDGIHGAFKSIRQIIAWSLISATVGVILRVIENRSKIVGQIVASVLGAAWNIMTYFSLISLVISKTSVKDSFKESASIIRKTWGEALIVNTGMGLFFGLIIISSWFLLLVIGMMIQDPAVWIVLAAIGVVFLIVIITISSTLGAIFKFALYEYGQTGKIIPGFTPDVVVNAFKK